MAIYAKVSLGDMGERTHSYPHEDSEVCVQHPSSKVLSKKLASEIEVGDLLCAYPPGSQWNDRGYEVISVGTVHPDVEE